MPRWGFYNLGLYMGRWYWRLMMLCLFLVGISRSVWMVDGYYGHHEVLIPTALYHQGYRIQDFGGKGSFVPQGYEERFYLSNDTTDVCFPYGTMLHKPLFENVLAQFPLNKLVHPIK